MSKQKKYSMMFEYYGVKPEKTLDEATPQQQVKFLPSLVVLGNQIPPTELSKINDLTNQLLTTPNVLPPTFEQKAKEIGNQILKFGVDKEKANAVIKDMVEAYKEIKKNELAASLKTQKAALPAPTISQQPTRQIDMPSVEDISVLKRDLQTVTDETVPQAIKIKVLANTREDLKKLGETKVANMIDAEFKPTKKNPFGSEHSPFGLFYAKLFKEVFGKDYKEALQGNHTMAQAAKLFRR